jgi:hypothetical protein
MLERITHLNSSFSNFRFYHVLRYHNSEVDRYALNLAFMAFGTSFTCYEGSVMTAC